MYPYQYLERAACRSERLRRLIEAERPGDQRRRLDQVSLEQAQRGVERTAARAGDGDLINNKRRQIERGRAMERAFQHQRTARTQQPARRFEPAGVTGAVDG